LEQVYNKINIINKIVYKVLDKEVNFTSLVFL